MAGWTEKMGYPLLTVDGVYCDGAGDDKKLASIAITQDWFL